MMENEKSYGHNEKDVSIALVYNPKGCHFTEATILYHLKIINLLLNKKSCKPPRSTCNSSKSDSATYENHNNERHKRATSLLKENLQCTSGTRTEKNIVVVE